MEKKVKYIIGIFLISPVVFLLIYSLFIPSGLCQLTIDFKKANYQGVLIDKYIDRENHGTKTLIIKVKDENIALILPRDTINLFEYVLIGDTITKKIDEDYIIVSRNNTRKKAKIYFGCDE